MQAISTPYVSNYDACRDLPVGNSPSLDGIGHRGGGIYSAGGGMKIERKWAMPNASTFEIEPIARFVGKYVAIGVWIDPFARNSRFSRFCAATNDLWPDADTTHHMEALEFLKGFATGSVDGVIFDPPYSPRQISECYKGIGLSVSTEDTQSSFYSNRKDQIARIVKPGGYVLSFGWNSNGVGLSRGFDMLEALIVAHGGAHNDTICTSEVKRNDLFSTGKA